MLRKVMSVGLICLFLVGVISCGGKIEPTPTGGVSPTTSKEEKPAVSESKTVTPKPTEPKAQAGKIIFERQENFYNLYIINADGTNEIEIERGGREVKMDDPTLKKSVNTVTKISDITPSPDGRKVVYQITYQAMPPYKHEVWYDLYLVNIDGTGKTKMESSARGARKVCWSPDSKIVSYVTGRSALNKGRFVLFNTDTGEREEVMDYPTYSKADYQWSPDSSKILIQYGEEGWRIRTIEGDELKLEAVMSSMPVRWSADGKKIFYMEKPQGNLVSINPDGTDKTRIIPASINKQFKFVNVTSEKILYQTQPSNIYPSLWVSDLDGNNHEMVISDMEDLFVGEKKIMAVSNPILGERATFVVILKTIEKTEIHYDNPRTTLFSPDEEWLVDTDKDQWGDWYLYIMNLNTMRKIEITEPSKYSIQVYAWVP